MDEMNLIIQAVGSIGFPIVACGYLMTTFKNTMDHVADVLSNNTTLLARILEKLNLDEEGEIK